MLVGTGFDSDAVFHQDVGGFQDLFAAVHEIGEMMEPATRAASVEGDRKVIRLESCRQPAAHFGSIIENDLLGHTKPEQLVKKLPVGFYILCEQVDVVQPLLGTIPCGLYRCGRFLNPGT
jgi:hypothetical protein